MKRISLFLGFSLILLAACSHTVSKIILKTDRGQIPLAVEIADSEEERGLGLMFREKLEEGSGMLFVFEDEAPRGFWMKNTKIPLDIVFFDRGKKAVSFVENMEPCAADLCPNYFSEKPAMYALELPAQAVEKYGIKIGDKIIK